MEKKKKMGVMAQLLMLCVIPLVVMVASVTVYSVGKMRGMVRDVTMEGLHNLCQSVYAAYESLDPGDYRMEGEALYKGDYCITDHVDVIDRFVAGSTADVTLFYGDTRRARPFATRIRGSVFLGRKRQTW